ncbi:SDR family oxidoreductase [Piscinibacter sp. XHJ-5]|uniref:NAD(P)-dependent oxidoreductase n=1 Tax=Piscinibacter sp. XHJ-5 TaxID=3037797 RepID=UPI002452F520|nr:SDR family oxidoreductase [Piscinibacter sp. XHJ-5]
MKVLVVGATGGSGRAAVSGLLAAGHEVTAFSRRAQSLQAMSPALRCVNGDAMSAGDVERAVQGHDAVIVVLGIAESALRVRLLGSAGTPMDVRSAGTRNVVAAMKRHGVRRLVVQSSFGVGETRHKLPWVYRLMFALLLKPQIADTERQEREVRASGLDWVIAQPVNLTDTPADTPPFVSAEGQTRRMQVSRQQVGRFLADVVRGDAFVGRSVALSGG